MRKLSRLEKKRIAIGGGLITAVVLFGLGIAIIPPKVKDYLSVPETVSTNSVSSKITEDYSNRRYIGDVTYTGPIKYPELYDYPFKRSESYKRNKDLQRVDKEKAVSIVKGFFNDLYNTGYREIASDAEGYKDKLLKYFDIQDMLFINTNQSEYFCDFTFPQDYIEQVSDHIVGNEINAHAEFITNESLVYSDGFYYIRGMLEYTPYNSDDSLAASGETQTYMLDVEFKNSVDDLGSYQITGIEPVKGYMESVSENEAKE